MKTTLAAFTLVSLAAPAFAACPDSAVVDAFVAARAAAEPTSPPVAAGGALKDGFCAQTMVVERLSADLGPVVGWKAGLTSTKSQEAFGVTEPVIGTLLQGMLLESGATVRADEAVRALFEADLIVEIADDAIMDAKTPEEALAHIRGVRPFLELPALVVGPDEKFDGAALTSINVGAWKGVMGPLVEIPAGAEGVALMAGLTARLVDQDGAVISEASGSAVLGNPLNAVIWAADALRRQGLSLEAGSLVSVGSIGPLSPIKPGMTVTLSYDGLPGAEEISVSFE
ncbi:MAG: 2-keto-4-pentenoate hydratase [Pikeienuella sp.]